MAWKKLSYRILEIKSPYKKGTKNIEVKEDSFIFQERVEKAFNLALCLDEEGYNVYVCGPRGIGRTRYTLKRIKEIASQKETPPDICYVNNFKEPYKPKALVLPPGYGKKLAEGIERILDFLKKETSKAFEGKEYEEELAKLSKEIDAEKEKVMNELVEKAKEHNLVVLFGPEGIRLMPQFKVQTPVPQEELLNDPQIREQYQKHIKEFEPTFREYIRRLRELDNAFGDSLFKLREKIAQKLIDRAFAKLEEEFKEVKEVQEYIKSLKRELSKNLHLFIEWEKAKGNFIVQANINKALNVFRINVLVDNSETRGAPVVHERIPTLKGLFGQINYRAEMGILYADHLSLTAGTLHRANGGYLVLDLWELLKNPYIWILLKRALLHKKLYLMGGMAEEIPVPHVGLLPEPVPFSAKVFLIGDRYLYHFLSNYDEEFLQLFKIKAEFDPVIKINNEILEAFPKIIKKIVEEKKLKELDASALSEIFKFAVYKSGNKNKINVVVQNLIDVLREADVLSKNEVITGEDIRRAVKEKILRVNLVEEKIRELVKEGKIILDTEGEKIGQINGLSVYDLGDYSFGKPSRITANVFPGSKGIVNIEKEIDMSGPIHSKGVLILSSYLYNKYSSDFPLQLSCTITFEQAYEPVEGDSASAAELIAILSAISKVPVKQYIAVTGSVDQFGNIQPVGGIKEKIEGFYKVCKIVNFTGKQGVIVPAKNFDNILLDEEVLEDIKARKFHIYIVETIDDVIEILTGIKAERFHKKVLQGLKDFYEKSKEKPSKKSQKKKKK
jgi:predicted ATP-dependent protease